MLKQKGLKAIIISLLIILSTTCFSLLYSNIYKTFTKEESQARQVEGGGGGNSQGYTFSYEGDRLNKEGDSDSIYNDNTKFYITTGRGFNEFAISVAYGYDFATKNVYLSNDIDMSGISNCCPVGASMDGTANYNGEKPFKGKFYGQGNTIENITTTVSERATTSGNICLGLFSYLNGAEISNVRIKNYTITVSDFAVEVYIGGFAGYAEGNVIITGCGVDNFTINNSSEDLYVSGFVGYRGHETDTDLAISECFLYGYTINQIAPLAIELTRPAQGSPSNMGTSAAIYASDGTFTNIVVNTSTTSFRNTTYCGICIYTVTETNIITTAETTAGLSCSSTAGNTGTTWYYISGYKENYPYLRQFIKNWGTIYFDTDNNSSYDTTHTYPSDFINTVATNWVDTQLNSSQINLPGGVVTASNNIAGKDFDGWGKGSDYHYSATYLDDEYGVIFWRPQYNGSYIDCSVTYNGTTTPLNETTYRLDAEGYVTYGDNVSVSYSLTENTITYTIGSITATYTIPEIYELDNYGTLGLDGPQIINGMSVSDYPNLKNLLITPQLKLKEINLTFPIVDYTTRTGNSYYTVDYGTTISVAKSDTECSYTFGSTTVTYTVTNSHLYKIANANLNNNFTVTESKIIQPSVEQYQIYVQFNNIEIGEGCDSIQPTRSDQFTIAYNSSADPHFTITNTMPDNGIENKTLTYTLNGSTTVTYTIPAIYVLEDADAGIHATDTQITITPQLQEKYMVVIFKQNNTELKRAIMDKGTNVSAVTGYDNGWDKETSTIHLSYTHDILQTEALTFEIPKTQYYAGWEQEEQVKDKVVIIHINIKTYTIVFG